MSDKLKVSILGATGYGGGELLRLLIQSREFDVVYATSRSQSGTPVSTVHRNLEQKTDLAFSNPDPAEVAEKSDFIIGALPHGASAEHLAPYVKLGKRVVDLSGDFRLKDIEQYKKWYKREHPNPELLSTAVYGAPEFNLKEIREANLVASPGCFATAINLAMLPAAANGMIKGTPTVFAMTGSSGSGAEAKAGTHHPVRSMTLKPYKFLQHQHTPEIVQLAGIAGSKLEGVSFIPISAPISRGILATVVCELNDASDTSAVERVYEEFYNKLPKAHQFVKVLKDREPECASIESTNYVEVRPRVGDDGKLYIVSSLDNLVKGGAGQAVQCLYTMAGLEDKIMESPLGWWGTWP